MVTGGIRRLLRRAREVRLAGGWPGLAGAVGRKPLSPVVRWRTLRFFEKSLARPNAGSQPRVPVAFRLLTDDDLALVCAVDAGDMTPDAFRARRAAGDRVVGGFVRESLAHFQWFTLVGCRLEEDIAYNARPLPGAALLYHAVTVPEWRGRGVHPVANNFIFDCCRSLGLTHAYTWVYADNAASLKNQARLDLRPVGELSYVLFPVLGRRRVRNRLQPVRFLIEAASAAREASL